MLDTAKKYLNHHSDTIFSLLGLYFIDQILFDGALKNRLTNWVIGNKDTSEAKKIIKFFEEIIEKKEKEERDE